MKRNLPGGQNFQLSGERLNKIERAIERFDKLSVTPPLILKESSGGKAIAYIEPSFMAVICASCDSSSSSAAPGTGHCIKEIEATTGGSWRVKPGGKRTWGAYENNGIETAMGSVIRVYPVGNGEYRFAWPGPVVNPIPCEESSSSSSHSSSSHSVSESSSSDSNCVCDTANSLTIPSTQCIDGVPCTVNTVITFPPGFEVGVCVCDPNNCAGA